MSSIQICILAYNLEDEISDNIKSVIQSAADLDFKIYVMINGCTDNTLAVTEHLSKQDARIIPIHITLGDKSNAWNVFVYEHYDRQSIPLFLDGDLVFSDNAISSIVEFYHQNSQVNSISGFPWDGGRSSKVWQESLLKNKEFTGNIYILSPHFLNRMIDKNIKLPVGLIGDDSMLGFLTATDLCAGDDKPLERREVCQDAVFSYKRLNPFSLTEIKFYLRRRQRYSLRRYQQNTIVGLLKTQGCEAMPLNAFDVFKNEDDIPKLKWRGVDTWFDYLALKQIKNKELSK